LSGQPSRDHTCRTFLHIGHRCREAIQFRRDWEEVQKMTDDEIRRMEELSRKKEAEVMQV
jgi:hypothetical protein